MGVIATASCSHPPLPVHIVGIPGSQQNAKLARPYATVVVHVDASGHVTSTSVDDSSGDATYDALGERAISSWTFAPAKSQCKAVAGTAEYVIGEFQETTFEDPCNHLATVLRQAEPDFPDSAVGRAASSSTVATRVTLDPVGRLIDVKVTTSSGYQDLDSSTFRAALQSQYFPKVDHCLPTIGDYLLRITFDPNR